MDVRNDPAPKERSIYVVLATAVFLGCAAYEIGRIVLDAPWSVGESEVAAVHSYVISGVLATIWTLSALFVALRRTSPFFARTAWFLAIVGTALMLPHAGLARLHGHPLGFLYLAPFALNVLFLKRLFAKGEFHRLRHAVQREDRPDGLPKDPDGRRARAEV